MEYGNCDGVRGRRFNVKETKNRYSAINNLALQGIEVVTYKKDIAQNQEVSHVKKSIVDYLLKTIVLHKEETFDEELKICTISIPEIDLYGEGPDKETAIVDLIQSIHSYLLFYEESEYLSRHESPHKQAAVLKLLRCGNEAAMRQELGL